MADVRIYIYIYTYITFIAPQGSRKVLNIDRQGLHWGFKLTGSKVLIDPFHPTTNEVLRKITVKDLISYLIPASFSELAWDIYLGELLIL